MRDEIVARQRAAMAAAGLDALVAVSPENFAHVAGFVVPSQPLMRWRHAAAAVSAGGATGLICVDMEESTVRARAPGEDIRVWREFADRPMATLAALLRDMGLAKARIGIELAYLPAADHAELIGLLPGARIEAADDLFDRLRRIKTADEIALLGRLARIADAAIADGLRAARPGKTEMDIAAALTRGVYARGAEQFRLMIVATGPRSELPNVGPSERVLEEGDICRVEIFAMIGGYHAGVCRTGAVGRPRAEAERLWAHLVECKHMILEMIRPGAGARAIYEKFRARFAALGLPPIAFVGHGIGLHLHEAPYLGAADDDTLEAGMVLGIEPLVYRTGLGFGLQLKDMVAVTENGAALLSDVTDTERLFAIG